LFLLNVDGGKLRKDNAQRTRKLAEHVGFSPCLALDFSLAAAHALIVTVRVSRADVRGDLDRVALCLFFDHATTLLLGGGVTGQATAAGASTGNARRG